MADSTLDRVWPLFRLRPNRRGHIIVHALDLRRATARPRRIGRHLPEECMAQRQEDIAAVLTHFSEESVEAQPVSGSVAQCQSGLHDGLDGGEIVLCVLKPSLWYLVLVSVRWLAGAVVVILLAPLFFQARSGTTEILTQSALLVTAARLILALLQWSSRLYVLTNRRVMCYHGVMHVSLFESPLVHIRNTYVNASPVERICKVGSIGFSLQGDRQIDVWWEQVSDPDAVHQRIRRAIEKALDNHLPY